MTESARAADAARLDADMSLEFERRDSQRSRLPLCFPKGSGGCEEPGDLAEERINQF